MQTQLMLQTTMNHGGTFHGFRLRMNPGPRRTMPRQIKEMAHTYTGVSLSRNQFLVAGSKEEKLRSGMISIQKKVVSLMLQKEYKRLRQYIYNPGWSVEHIIHLLFIYLISSILVIFTYFIFFKLTCVRLGLLILPHEVCNYSCHCVILLPEPSVVKVSVSATSGK